MTSLNNSSIGNQLLGVANIDSILQKVIKGTILLGAVKEIRDYELRVNLANNVIGSVSITNMADGYTGLLKRFAESSEDQSVAEVRPPII